VDLQKSTPFTQCVWRATSCIVVMAPWALWSLRTQGLRGASDTKTFALMLATAVCWSGWFAGFYYGIVESSIAHAYMLGNTHSAVIVVFNLITGRERVPTVNVVGVVVAIVGAADCICDSSRHEKTSPRPPGTIPSGTPTVLGDVVVTASACFGAAFLVLAKTFREKVELSHYMWLSMVVNLPMSLAAAMILEDISFARPFDPAVGVLGWMTREQIGLQLFISVLGARA
jgi:drug/metabolite transporter (DMT)-like permease